MALDSFLGPRTNLLIEDPAAAELVHLPSVVISEFQLKALATMDRGRLKGGRISTLFAIPEEGSAGVLEAALNRILTDAEAAVRAGTTLLVLSDRGVDAEHAAVPMLLVVGAIHHELIRKGLRMNVELICETGEVWDVHHLACLIGFGAAAIHPYLALSAVADLVGNRGFEDKSAGALQRNYVHMLEYGMLKVSSKMGISTISGYKGAQIFEAIGISEAVIDRYFAGTPTRLGGIGLTEIEADVLRRHTEAFTQPVAKRMRSTRPLPKHCRLRQLATTRSTSRPIAIWSPRIR
jgi:glutamate synthase (ferredoxin)